MGHPPYRHTAIKHLQEVKCNVTSVPLSSSIGRMTLDLE